MKVGAGTWKNAGRRGRARRERTGLVRLAAQEALRSGKLVIEAEDVSYGTTMRSLSSVIFPPLIMRGDKVGIMVPTVPARPPCCAILLGSYATAGQAAPWRALGNGLFRPTPSATR